MSSYVTKWRDIFSKGHLFYLIEPAFLLEISTVFTLNLLIAYLLYRVMKSVMLCQKGFLHIVLDDMENKGKNWAKPPLRHSHEMQNSANRGLSPPPIIPNKLIIHRPQHNGMWLYLKDHSHTHKPDICYALEIKPCGLGCRISDMESFLRIFGKQNRHCGMNQTFS